MNGKILLVQPEFPVPHKSLNHKDFLPLPLLKIASYHKSIGDSPFLVHGAVNVDIVPKQIYITSLFTYWQKEFWDAVEFYRNKFKDTPISVGGIYVSLFYENEKFQERCKNLHVESVKGTVERFENMTPDYDLVDVNYQIIHSSRGCIRHCPFCGVWKLEPNFIPKKSIRDEIEKNKVIFYDNNLLANPYIDEILKELAKLRINKKLVYSECQSGFDGRLLTLERAKLLKEARFNNPRIAWDSSFADWENIEKQLKILFKADYKPKEVSVFMVYNWDYTFEEMELKRKKCYEWGIQIADCRYRPLNQEFDNYDGATSQTNKDYYIHESHGWTDSKVKIFRKNVRRQNICVRHGFRFHSSKLERMKISKSKYYKIIDKSKYKIKKILPDAWWPDEDS